MRAPLSQDARNSLVLLAVGLGFAGLIAAVALFSHYFNAPPWFVAFTRSPWILAPYVALLVIVVRQFFVQQRVNRPRDQDESGS